jgi:1,4-dihydroxy-2-naphthoate octaprenyltransferase
MKAPLRETVVHWVLAARPKTLVASLIPVLAGASLAYGDTGKLPLLLLALAVLFSLLVQIGTNFSNDYFDDLRGADQNRTLGPTRAVSSGLISGQTMIRASLVLLVIAFCIGVVLMEVSGASRQLLWVGVLSVVFAVGYTGGPFPLAYVGLGDLFVVLFFGFVAVCGTHYVLVIGAGEEWHPNWIAPLGIGLVINNLLVVNNTRDCREDKLVGKRTLVVLMGRRFGILLYAFGIVVATLVCPYFDSTIKVLAWVFPLGLFCLVKLANASTREQYGSTLSLTAITILAYGSLFVFAYGGN